MSGAQDGTTPDSDAAELVRLANEVEAVGLHHWGRRLRVLALNVARMERHYDDTVAASAATTAATLAAAQAGRVALLNDYRKGAR